VLAAKNTWALASGSRATALRYSAVPHFGALAPRDSLTSLSPLPRHPRTASAVAQAASLSFRSGLPRLPACRSALHPAY